MTWTIKTRQNSAEKRIRFLLFFLCAFREKKIKRREKSSALTRFRKNITTPRRVPAFVFPKKGFSVILGLFEILAR